MKFTKMQGAGNDYIYIDCFKEEVNDRPALARRLSDRHFGIGGDGIICICPSEIADVKMDMYNLDGSSAQMCGNGIRCVAKYAYEHGYAKGEIMTVETALEVKTISLEVEDGVVKSARVCMGKPELRPGKIPVLAEGDVFLKRPIEAAGKTWEATCLSVGNPHCVIFVDDVDSLDLASIGPEFENHKLFPERINTEFAQIVDSGTIKMRVWERGSGETLACGTGATATLAAASICGLTGESAVLKLLGGELKIEWDKKENLLYMTGPAEYVFSGEIEL